MTLDTEEQHAFPTIVVAHEDGEIRRALIDNLSQYNVLEAKDVPTLVEIVLTQSRPLHVLLTDASPEKRHWVARLQQRRRKMLVWYVERSQGVNASDVLSPEVALMNVRELFEKNGESHNLSLAAACGSGQQH